MTSTHYLFKLKTIHVLGHCQHIYKCFPFPYMIPEHYKERSLNLEQVSHEHTQVYPKVRNQRKPIQWSMDTDQKQVHPFCYKQTWLNARLIIFIKIKKSIPCQVCTFRDSLSYQRELFSLTLWDITGTKPTLYIGWSEITLPIKYIIIYECKQRIKLKGKMDNVLQIKELEKNLENYS